MLLALIEIYIRILIKREEGQPSNHQSRVHLLRITVVWFYTAFTDLKQRETTQAYIALHCGTQLFTDSIIDRDGSVCLLTLFTVTAVVIHKLYKIPLLTQGLALLRCTTAANCTGRLLQLKVVR
jgi:hypothetical protein